MGRHGKKFCMICNPFGNGSRGMPGTEAVGVYYLPKGKNQMIYGNISVCENCANSTSPYFKVTYFDGAERKPPISLLSNSDPKIKSGIYHHKWDKMSLVGIEIDGNIVDHYKCLKCGAEGYWRLADFTPDCGCSIPDGGLK
jgi:hypothetical protein